MSTVKQLPIPPEFRPLYKRSAWYVYEAISGDCPEVEGYSLKALVEIIRDANRISGLGLEAVRHSEQKESFCTWLKAHEYSEEYRQDMNRAVREVLTGR